MRDLRKAANLPTEKTAVFNTLAGLLIPPLQALARIEIVDGEKLPVEGAVVVAPNHFSNVDPAVVGAAMYKLGRMPHYLAKVSLFSVPIFGWLLRHSEQVPVERTGVVRGQDPIGAADAIVKAGHAVVIYAEGSLTRDPNLWPMRGKTGAVRMALLTGAPLIPVAHWGTQLIDPREGHLRLSPFPRKVLTVKFGDPVDLSEFSKTSMDPATLHAATAKLMKAITALLEEVRGEKAPDEIWDPVKHNQSEIGKF
ncbi:lysophospholipid acyltransferase family protein [soil metagenome]